MPPPPEKYHSSSPLKKYHSSSPLKKYHVSAENRLIRSNWWIVYELTHRSWKLAPKWQQRMPINALNNQSSHFSLSQISSISTTDANQSSSHFNHSSRIFQPLSQIFQPHSNILDILSNILNILLNILNIFSNILHLTSNMMGIVWCGLRPMLQFHFVPDLTNK